MKEPKRLEPEEYLPYENKWIAIDESGDSERIAGSGDTLQEAKDEASRAGCAEPVLMRVPPLNGGLIATPFATRYRGKRDSR